MWHFTSFFLKFKPNLLVKRVLNEKSKMSIRYNPHIKLAASNVAVTIIQVQGLGMGSKLTLFHLLHNNCKTLTLVE